MRTDRDRAIPSPPEDADTRALAQDELDPATQVFQREPAPADSGALELVMQHRPTDHVGARRVLANLEARLIGPTAAPQLDRKSTRLNSSH